MPIRNKTELKNFLAAPTDLTRLHILIKNSLLYSWKDLSKCRHHHHHQGHHTTPSCAQQQAWRLNQHWSIWQLRSCFSEAHVFLFFFVLFIVFMYGCYPFDICTVLRCTYIYINGFQSINQLQPFNEDHYSPPATMVSANPRL